ncbi:hypothetical protein ES702_01269 [subsurface metagenome]
MNFFKKISPKFVAFLIIVYLSFTLTGCPSAPLIKTDKAIAELWVTYYAYLKLNEKEEALWLEYNVMVNKVNAIKDDMAGLAIREKEKIGKLSQEGLDINAEEKEMLSKIRECFYDKSNIISKLQGIVTKITDPSINLLAQEMADKLREINNLEIEKLGLFEKEIGYSYSLFKDGLFVSQGKMTMEELIKSAEEREGEIEENHERLYELRNTIEALIAEVSDLTAKLESLTMPK